MLKILTSANSSTNHQNTAEKNRHRSEQAVDIVLKTKPGGLIEIESQLEMIQQWENQLSPFRVQHTDFYVVGIGGSSLGVQVFAEVFQKKNFYFVDNVDAFHFEAQLKSISNLEKTGWLFISKSGRTIETLATLEFVQQFYQQNSVSLESHCLVITEEKNSDLYNWAQNKKTTVFPIPLSVGGRFSVLSSVGLVPAILMGLNLKEIRNGALKAYNERQSLVTLTEQVLSSFSRKEWVTLLWSYSSRLKSFGSWWQQLWAESLAKKITRKNQTAERVSTPVPLVGATDQHSVLQQVMDGEHDKFVLFLRVGSAEGGQMTLKNPQTSETQSLRSKTLGELLKAEAQATQNALEQIGVSNLSLQVSDLNEQNIGFLLMFFQLLVMSLGEALDINTFDQPGVELGKVMAKKLLNERSKQPSSLSV